MDNEHDKPNGNGHAKMPVNHLIITVDLEQFHVTVAGHVANTDLGITMLRMALDEFDARRRIERATQFAEQQRIQAENAAVAAALRKR